MRQAFSGLRLWCVALKGFERNTGTAQCISVTGGRVVIYVAHVLGKR